MIEQISNLNKNFKKTSQHHTVLKVTKELEAEELKNLDQFSRLFGLHGNRSQSVGGMICDFISSRRFYVQTKTATIIT